jgi:hypothetical protein
LDFLDTPRVGFLTSPCTKIYFSVTFKLTAEGAFADMEQIMPHIEENIPLPQNAADALPDLSPVEELNMRANVIKLIGP